MNVYVYMYIYVCMYVCMYVCITMIYNIYKTKIKCKTRIYVHMSTHLCVYVHVYMCLSSGLRHRIQCLMRTPNESADHGSKTEEP